ncbi:MAG: FAD:protein FMN transferase [Spirochaetes bacterium]|nr:FAD:protein FMN transferase [Spirochaetota bacterium]
MISKNKATIFLFISILFFYAGCNANSRRYSVVSATNIQLGTLIELTIHKGGSNDILREAFELIFALEEKLSRNWQTSEISEINRLAGISPVKVSDNTFFLLERSIYYSELSDGFFDITIGPVVSLWGIGTPDARVPSANEISAALELVGYRRIRLMPAGNMVFLEERGMEIDLGGIAKGFIADKVYKLFRERGVTSAIINLGGDVRLLGRRPDNRLFRIGIQDPFERRGVHLGIFEGEDISIAASGIYQRYFEEGGKRYHHIFNPKTGYPIDNDIAGLSVFTALSIDADALATVLFALGAKGALDFAEELDGVEVIIVTNDKKIFLSSGVGSSFSLANSDFTIVKN